MKVTAPLLIFVGLLATAIAFNCYECNTFQDLDCEDEYTSPSDHLINCTDVYRYDDGACHKHKMEVKMNGAMYTVVYRGCGRTPGGNTTCEHKQKYLKDDEPFQGDGWTCNCYGDSCNGGVEVTATSLLLAAAAGALAIY